MRTGKRPSDLWIYLVLGAFVLCVPPDEAPARANNSVAETRTVQKDEPSAQPETASVTTSGEMREDSGENSAEEPLPEPTETEDELSVREALALHGEATVFDMRIDTMMLVEEIGYEFKETHRAPLGFVPWMGHVDLPRARAAGLDGMWLSILPNPVWGDGPAQVRESLRIAKESVIAPSSPTMEVAYSVGDLERIVAEGRMAVQFHLIGAHGLGNAPEAVTGYMDEFYQAGVRAMSMSFLINNEYSASALATDPDSPGLTPTGRRIVKHANDLGIVLDLTYAHPASFRDIVHESRAPIVVANTGASAIERSFRNLEDWQIKAIAQKDGVIGVTFAPQWLSQDMYPSLAIIIKHMLHIKNLVGARHLALGSGFDGFSWLPRGMWDVRDLPKITVALAKTGFTAAEIRGILGENLLRVMRAVENLRTIEPKPANP